MNIQHLLRFSISGLGCLLLFWAFPISTAHAVISDGANAVNAAGQLNGAENAPVYTKSAANNGPGTKGLNSPGWVAIDSVNHRLFVSDVTNNRVLVFNLDTSNNLVDYGADNVLGQPDFTTSAAGTTQSKLSSPQGLVYNNGTNKLFVADSNNNRVMVFDVTAITDGENAVNVLGQSDYISSGSSTDQNRLNNPRGLAYDSTGNKLFVVDSSNSRVMVFDVASISDGENAANVLGQLGFIMGASGTSQSALSFPRGVVYDSATSKLFVADNSNNRVMVFDVAAITNGENAVSVLGQTDYITSSSATTQSKLSFPEGLAYDSTGRKLFVGDSSSNRVMVFDVTTIGDGEAAVSVLGQTDYVTSTSGTTQAKLNAPNGIAYDSGGGLFVADLFNNRVMVFNVASITNGENAVNAAGQLNAAETAPSYTKSSTNNGPNTKGLSSSTYVAMDSANHRLFVSDSSNNRVLVFDLDTSNNLVNYVADNVLGQPDLVTSSSGSTQAKLSSPQGLAYDSGGNRLFVADSFNNRVIVFNVASITDGENAVNVLGQSNFTGSVSGTTQGSLNSPQGLAYDSTGNRLFAGDSFNNRVMVFNVASITDGENAVNVLGQPDFITGSFATSQTKLGNPQGVAYESGGNRLFVGDNSSNRVMVFDVTAITDGENAANVLGQFSFFGSGSGTTQSTLSFPRGVVYDSTGNRLFVGDTSNNRVLVFDVAVGVISDGQNAVNVLGQSNYTTSTGDTTQARLSSPQGLVYDSAGSRLWVGDSGNNRLMAFDAAAATVDLESATNVLGQPDFTTSSSDATQAKLNSPDGLAFDSGGNRLLVGDSFNNRVMVFDVATITNGENAVNAAGQLNAAETAPSYTKNAANNGPNTKGLSLPHSMAIDAANHRLFVSDSSNHRVLIFNLDGSNNLVDYVADNVLGQPDLVTSSSGTTQAKFNAPRGLAHDSTGNRLFVVDGNNNRVMVFDVAAITDGENAVSVLGQSDYITSSSGTTQAKLSFPQGLAYDGTGNRLFVADNSNSRIMVFDVAAITNGENAVSVLGQLNFTSGSGSTSQSTLNFPEGLAYDGTGNRLFVADNSNSRVMVFDVTAITDGENAANVLGQLGFVTGFGGVSQSSLSYPRGVVYDSTGNKLYVADSSNSRIMVFDVAAIGDGENAVSVLGQSGYFSSSSATSQAGLNSPQGLTFLSNKLYVADNTNNRVMIFDVAAITNGEDAVNGLGQLNAAETAPSYTKSASNNGPHSKGFSSTAYLAMDSVNHRLFVSDSSNNRVLVFNLDTSNNLVDYGADYVLGQPDFVTSTSGTSQAKFNSSRGLAYDSGTNKLFVADSWNNRVMVFDVASISDGENAVNVLGQPDFVTSLSGTAQSALSNPRGLAYDSGTNKLFVADGSNNRVLVFDVTAIANGENAVNVLGQADYTSSSSATAQTRLSSPQGLAFLNNRLSVADSSNNRVMEFDVASITNGENAVNVLGQGSYVLSTSATTQTKLSSPQGLAFDSTGSKLFVGDNFNNRVMVFSNLAPAVTANSATVRTDGTKIVDISVTVTDSQAHNVKLKVLRVNKSGATCGDDETFSSKATLDQTASNVSASVTPNPEVTNANPYQVGTTTPILTSLPNTVQFDWNAPADTGGSGGEYCLQFIANDGIADGTAAYQSVSFGVTGSSGARTLTDAAGNQFDARSAIRAQITLQASLGTHRDEALLRMVNELLKGNRMIRNRITLKDLLLRRAGRSEFKLIFEIRTNPALRATLLQLVTEDPELQELLRGQTSEGLILEVWKPGNRKIPLVSLMVSTNLFGEAELLLPPLAPGNYDFTIRKPFGLAQVLLNVPLQNVMTLNYPDPIRVGDLDGDGKVNTTDFKSFMENVKKTAQEVKVAEIKKDEKNDINGDGKIDLKDIAELLRSLE